jgi:hypothetical protein
MTARDLNEENDGEIGPMKFFQMLFHSFFCMRFMIFVLSDRFAESNELSKSISIVMMLQIRDQCRNDAILEKRKMKKCE